VLYFARTKRIFSVWQTVIFRLQQIPNELLSIFTTSTCFVPALQKKLY